MRFFSLVISTLMLLVININTTQAQMGANGNNSQLKTPWYFDVKKSGPLPEYPRPQFKRDGKWESLNGIWKYAITNLTSSSKPIFNKKIIVPFAIESELSGVCRSLKPDETLWYKKIIHYTPELGNLLLHFGAVDYACKVYINTKLVGAHEGGYTAFSFDISKYLKMGQNELILEVIDRTDQGVGPHGKQVLNPSNIYYTQSSGIWQTVWVEYVPVIRFTDLKYDVDIDKSIVSINIGTNVQKGGLKNNYVIETELLYKGKSITSSVTKLDSTISLYMQNPKLWTPDTPNLYSLNFKLVESGKILDKVTSYCGMRKITISKDRDGHYRILINNKFVYNLGLLDQGYWPDGLYTAPTDEALKFDIIQAKNMGFNTIRKHIKIEPQRWYYYADSIGMIVWQDFVNPNQALPEGAKSAFESQLKETIDQLKMHPSITTWVLFNERWGAYDQSRLTEWIKNYDKSRLVNGHSGELLYVNDNLRAPSENPYVNSDIIDIHSYPFPRLPKSDDHKAMVIGEFGGISVSVPEHQWFGKDEAWGYSGLVTTDQLKNKYESMIDTLVVFKNKGLSGSIYTQPYDVESEQNGLLTYDRRLAKIPIGEIRRINSKLQPLNAEFIKLSKNIPSVFNSFKLNYDSLLALFRMGKRDSATLRSLCLLANSRGDSLFSNSLIPEYLNTIRNPFLRENLQVLKQGTNSIRDHAFQFAIQNYSKLTKSTLGERMISQCRTIIRNDIFPIYRSSTKENIEGLHTIAEKKFGEIAEPVSWELIAFFFYKTKDYDKWFEFKKRISDKYPMHTSTFDLNNDAWLMFTKSDNKEQLQTALLWSKRAIETEPTANYYDTYANILYKLGRKSEAIALQRKALTLVPGNGNIESVKKSLSLMEMGLPTWK